MNLYEQYLPMYMKYQTIWNMFQMIKVYKLPIMHSQVMPRGPCII